MANKELKSLLDNYLETVKTAAMDLEDVPAQTKIAQGTAKQLAIESLSAVKKAYTNALTKRIVKVFVSGDSAEFEAYLKKEGALTLNGNLLYEWLSTGLNNTAVFSPQHTIDVMGLLLEFCKANDIESIPMPRWDIGDHESQIKSHQDLVNILKKGVRATNGDTLTKFALTKYTFIEAINKKVDYNLVPVVIFSLTNEEITALSDTLFNEQQNIVLDVTDKKFDEIVATLNLKLQAANTALKRVTKENTNG
jgi:hypothetical protein